MKKYIKKFLLNNIRGYNVFDDILVISKKSGQNSFFELYDSNLNLLHSFVMNTIYGGYKIENQFVSFKRLGDLEIFNLEDFSKKTIPSKVSFIESKENGLFFNDLSNNKCCFYSSEEDVQSLFEISESDFLDYPKFVVSNLGIGYSKLNEVIFLEIKTGDILWEIDISAYFDKPSKIYEGRVLVVGERLVFFAHTEDWEQYATFVLDAKTGEILFTTQEMGLQLFEYNQQIYQIQEKRIKILNPNNLEIKTIALEEELSQRGLILKDKSACFHNHNLYTLARESSSDIYNIWVVINLESGKIEYQQAMLLDFDKKAKEDNKIFISNIQANNKLVGVQCTDRLYIFEREE